MLFFKIVLTILGALKVFLFLNGSIKKKLIYSFGHAGSQMWRVESVIFVAACGSLLVVACRILYKF